MTHNQPLAAKSGVKDRPILFGTPMVRALLEGRKTQTRRLCAWANNPNSPQLTYIVPCDEPGWFGDEEGECQFTVGWAPGDRAYVREAWKTSLGNDGVAPRDLDPLAPVLYLADGAERGRYPVDEPGKYRPGMHMPRWASRLTLFVEDVRVQRVQDISGDDAIAEGIEARGMGALWGWIDYLETNPNLTRHFASPRRSYASLWDSLHTEPGTRWDDNPWIYALTFRVARGNIDQLGEEGEA